MARRYGIPYQGSKNGIARQIIEFLPAGDVLVDICAGGCAITHAALEQMEGFDRKWNRVIANDINPLPLDLFWKSIHGQMRNEKRWISREEFFRLKDTDPYAKYCWSFGNDGETYMYGDYLVPWKHAMWAARVWDEWDEIEDILGMEMPPEAHQNLRLWIRRNADLCREKFGKNLKRPEFLQSLESLERLQSLQSLESLEISKLDFAQVQVPAGAVIYADIPYKDTDCRCYEGFDHERFYDWAAQQENIFISSYEIQDPRFQCVWEIEKYRLMSAKGAGKKGLERIYTVKRY